eukprot:4262176-Amphidinium_carterae.2
MTSHSKIGKWLSVKQIMKERELEWSDFGGVAGCPPGLQFVKDAVQKNQRENQTLFSHPPQVLGLPLAGVDVLPQHCFWGHRVLWPRAAPVPLRASTQSKWSCVSNWGGQPGLLEKGTGQGAQGLLNSDCQNGGTAQSPEGRLYAQAAPGQDWLRRSSCSHCSQD